MMRTRAVEESRMARVLGAGAVEREGTNGAGTCAQQASGTVNILALLQWMSANG